MTSGLPRGRVLRQSCFIIPWIGGTVISGLIQVLTKTRQVVFYAGFSIRLFSHGVPFFTSLYAGFLLLQRGTDVRRLARPLAVIYKILTVGDRLSVLPVPGGRIRRPVNGLAVDVLIVLLQLFVDREYETDHRYIPRSGDVVVDAGAFLGLWSIYVARRVGRLGKVVSFEPNPLTFPQLSKNVGLNNFSNIVLMNNALGSSRGLVEFFTESGGHAMSSLFQQHVLSLAPPESIMRVRVEATTIDDLMEDKGIQRIDLLKIDTEGGEISILRGASKALRDGRIRKIIVEVHETVNPTEEVLHLLRENGFSIDHALRYPHSQVNRTLVYARLLPEFNSRPA